MANLISREAAAALIQEQVVGTIFQDAPKESVFLRMARKLPNMTSKQTRIPVMDILPMAYWVNGDTGTKQTSRQAWDNVFLSAAELAVIVPIPEAVMDDAGYDIVGEITPRINEAIGQRVDSAIIFGKNRPAEWQNDIITLARQSGNNVACPGGAISLLRAACWPRLRRAATA
ncbi:MAG: phage major capsid protein [Ruthenibacterium sp.]